MGPENEAEVQSNSLMKQWSWIDRMYQKLEDICVEVDKKPSSLIQETSKYVENQMFVVGTNVKKICAELIQDLLPPPDETVFDCPMHWKCDCKNSGKPKQGGSCSYTGVKDGKREGIEAVVHKKVIDVEKAEEKMVGVAPEWKETSKAEILTGAYVEKELVTVDNIERRQKSFPEVVGGSIENLIEVTIASEENKLEDTAASPPETGKDKVLIGQPSISKEYREHNDIREPKHSGSYRGCYKDVNEKHLSTENSIRCCGSKDESELNAKCGETIERDMQGMEGIEDRGASWRKDKNREMKMRQEEFRSADCLQNNLTACMKNSMYVHNGKIGEVELPVSEMDGYVKSMYSSTENVKSSGIKLLEADAWVSTFNHVSSKVEGWEVELPIIGMDCFAKSISSTNSMKIFRVKLEEADAWVYASSHVSSNEHQKLCKGETSMEMSGSLSEIDDEDELISDRWFSSNSNSCLFGKASNIGLDSEEVESDWVLV